MNPRDGKARAYIAHCAATGLVKIGVSTNHRRRISHLSTDSGFHARLVRILRGGAWRERALHRRFDAYHVGHEWFRPEGKLAAWLSAEGLHDCVGPINEHAVSIMLSHYARRHRIWVIRQSLSSGELRRIIPSAECDRILDAFPSLRHLEAIEAKYIERAAARLSKVAASTLRRRYKEQ